jgi:hypothetical protein
MHLSKGGGTINSSDLPLIHVSHHHIKLDLSAQVSLNELIHIYDINLPDVT